MSARDAVIEFTLQYEILRETFLSLLFFSDLLNYVQVYRYVITSSSLLLPFLSSPSSIIV